jgi:hypothetical protein
MSHFASLPIAFGTHATVDADDTVVSGIGPLKHVLVSLKSDPVEGGKWVTADIGDQAGAPAAGSFYLKSWKDTDADAAPVAATTFELDVDWIAIGA